MPPFQITLSPTKRAAGRFVTRVRLALQKALVQENRKRGITQSDIARELGIHRSVINRELRGEKDITVGRVGEIAHILGRRATFDLPERVTHAGANHAAPVLSPTVTPGTTMPPTFNMFGASQYPSQTPTPNPILTAA